MKQNLFMVPRAIVSDGEKKVCNLGYTLEKTINSSLKSESKFQAQVLKVVDVMMLKTKYRGVHINARSVQGGIAYEEI